MKKLIVVLIIVLIIIFVFSGCYFSVQESSEDNQNADIKLISPVPSDSMKDTFNVNLYYGFYDQEFLTLCPAEITSSYNDDNTANVLKALINNDVFSFGYTRLINPDTKVIDCTDNDGYLFVTLSKDFLEPPVNFSSTDMKENTRRYLAAYSIVNTMIDYGGYYRVQILIDRDDTGSGTPITNNECGLSGNDNFDAHGHNSDIVLDEQNTIKQIMSALEEKNYNLLYKYIAFYDTDGSERPSYDDFYQNITGINPTISDSALVGTSDATAENEKNVFVTFTESIGDNNAVSITDILVKLVREKGIWKICNSEFNKIFIEMSV